MAELEIHHEAEHELDPMGQRVGIMAAILAVLLAIVSILSHRTHTEAIIAKADANDQWSLYQARRLKLHNTELKKDLMGILATGHPDMAKGALERYEKETEKYSKDSEETMKEARSKEGEATNAELRGLRFDIGEGLLEIGLVLSSLYFIARRRLFPYVGSIAGCLGILIALTGFTIH